ncbi:MAG: CRP/FNR family cyclic AMP-dependent transcriptional regulator [Paracrocinitomix sp.]|jgi:CRP/FNR family cyclic AMP-dependent transcriptional regulator
MSFRNRAPLALRQSPLGHALPRRELNRLDQLGTTVEIFEGEQIIRSASPGRECFVVVDGQFKVVGSDFTGTITAGEVAGELALLTGRPRNASVASTASSVVYALHPREFATLLSEAPVFRSKVLRTASHRLSDSAVSLPAQLLPEHERSRA